MSAMTIFTEWNSVSTMNAGGGGGGALTHDDIITVFGCNKQLMIVDDLGLQDLLVNFLEEEDSPYRFVDEAIIRKVKMKDIFQLLCNMVWLNGRRVYQRLKRGFK